MKLPSRKNLALILSIGFHALLVAWIYHLESQRALDASWSGGRGVQAGTVYMTISALEEDGEQGTPTPDKKTVVQSKSVIKNPQNRAQPIPQKSATATGQSAPKNSGVGNSTTTAGGTGSGLDQNGLVSQNAPSVLAAIRKKIVSHQIYPFTARAQKLEGSVKINFKINADGSLAFSNVIQSSGHKILDAAALKAVKKSVPLPFYPHAIALVLEYALR